MDSAVDPNARFITPTGLPLGIICVSLVLVFFSILTTCLRTYSRLRDAVLGLDDALAIAGTILYTADVGLACYACWAGLGYRDAQLNAWQSETAMKFYIIWILVYVGALALVKSSACVSIYRISVATTGFRVAVWCLLFVLWASFFVTFVGTLLYCRPVQAIWDVSLLLSGEGTCAPASTFIALGQVATGTTIATDLGLVVVPALLLRRTQMKTQAKMQAFFLLSFASIASIITMVRIPYVNRFASPTDLKFWVAHIMLCSDIETGIGCIATSVPSIRRLFRSNPSASSTQNSNPARNSMWTFGSRSTNKLPGDRFNNPTDQGFSLATVHARPADDSWQRLDGDSDSGNLLPGDSAKGIRAEYAYEVEVERESVARERRL
ncbi:integral membrane protein [Purpureocillium lavendulum]|uniref:Integral membrane protein n=1 Tax=Purpureocillium lavendulum TaxID=1247861 RepID=A0AB34FYQ8_9HYPO|nr:integral membrane protein [Purpureocillium lavendulum]